MNRSAFPPTLAEVAKDPAIVEMFRHPDQALLDKIIAAMHGEKFMDKAPSRARASARKAAERVLAVVTLHIETTQPWLKETK